MENKLKPRESAFCAYFALEGNAEAAAKAAGYRNPVKAGARLLCRSDVTAEINRLSRERSKLFAALSAAGYQRLAFGSIRDAVSLLFMDCPDPKQLSEMDLFAVSEIKRPKDGAMEIKFFDRLKALEKLSECGEDFSEAKSLFDAIGESAAGDCDD